MINTRLAELIRRAGVLKKDFAESIDISTGNLSDWLRGRTEPSAKMLSRIHEKFKVNLNWLIAGKGEIFLNDDVNSGNGDYSKNDTSETVTLQQQIIELKQRIAVLEKKAFGRMQ